MKKLIYICSMAFIMLSAFDAKAQQGGLKLDLNYVVGIPVGGLNNLVSNVSPRGWQAGLTYDITPKVGLGIVTGMQDFYQKYPRTILHSEGSDISAVVSNSIQVSPVMLKGNYKFGKPGHIQPYVSLAAGADFAKYAKYYGEFADDYSKVAFAAQAGAGINIFIPSYRFPSFHIGADYNYMPFKNADANGFSFIGIKAGLSIAL